VPPNGVQPRGKYQTTSQRSRSVEEDDVVWFDGNLAAGFFKSSPDGRRDLQAILRSCTRPRATGSEVVVRARPPTIGNSGARHIPAMIMTRLKSSVLDGTPNRQR
jgi:hypothetical protein